MGSILPEQGVLVSERQIEAFPDKCPFQDPKNTGWENSLKQSADFTSPVMRERPTKPKGNEMEETETKTGLLSKKQDELTVGDAIKINLGAVAAVAVVYAGAIGGLAAYNKFANWRYNRKMAQEFPARETESKNV